MQINFLALVPPLMIFLTKSPLVARFDLTSVLQVLSAAAPLSKETELEACRALGIKVVLQGDGIQFPKTFFKNISLVL